MTMTLGTHSIEINRFNENLQGNPETLNASISFIVTDESEFPDLSGFKDLEFNYISIVNNDGITIPVQGTYSVVSMLSSSYEESVKLYSANIVLA